VRGKERQELSVHNVFGAPHGGGEITLKGVAEDAAFATVNGMIEITERGKGTDTYLTEDVLMLDPTAKIDAVPGLEIRTNDVKASHSATVSRVTAEDLFYFRSRGIDAATARDMYVDGFLGDLLARIKHDDLRETLRKKLSDGRRSTR
jgi:Fe-S cluster assembly scaffold protein SufB